MVTTAPITDLAAATHRGERIVDVRERHEFVSGHVPDSDWIPLSLVPLRVDELKGSTPVWLICETGNRSYQAASYLDRHGIRAISVDGGTAAWRSAGLPVTTGASA
jgi:rhodanese-related sulfurtransferase